MAKVRELLPRPKPKEGGGRWHGEAGGHIRKPSLGVVGVDLMLRYARSDPRAPEPSIWYQDCSCEVGKRCIDVRVQLGNG